MLTGLAKAKAAKRKIADLVHDLPELAGLGITKIGRRFAIKLNLTGPVDIELPKEIDGVPVKVEIVGRVRPLTPRP